MTEPEPTYRHRCVVIPKDNARADLHAQIDNLFPGDMLALLLKCADLVNAAGRGQVVLISRGGSVNAIVPCPHLRENDLTLFSIERGWG